MATEAGRSLLASNPERIDVERLLEFPSFREFYRADQTNSTDLEVAAGGVTISVAPPSFPPQATPVEQIELAYAAMQSALRTEVLQRILANSLTLLRRGDRRPTNNNGIRRLASQCGRPTRGNLVTEVWTA